MKETLKKIWWKVPLYSAVAGFASYWFMLGVVGRFAYVRLPDGTVSSNDALWMIASGAVFAAALLLGGLLFFRRMTRKEIACSATVMVLINVVMAVLSSLLPSGIAMLIVYTREWHAFVVDVLLELGVGGRLATVISWATVYLFVPFGKKGAA